MHIVPDAFGDGLPLQLGKTEKQNGSDAEVLHRTRRLQSVGRCFHRAVAIVAQTAHPQNKPADGRFFLDNKPKIPRFSLR